jgi:hypothetical protein
VRPVVGSGATIRLVDRARAYAMVLVSGCLLALDLVALPWHHFAVSIEGAGSFSLERTGVQSPYGPLGRTILALALALGAYAGAAWLLPRLRRWDALLPLLTPLVPALVVVKLVRHSRSLAAGAGLALVLAVTQAYAGLRLRRTR